MSSLRHVFAVDGGGTKTAAALVTASGQELARCRVGPANLYRDPAVGLATITGAWEQVCTLAGLRSQDVRAGTVISAGLAGASGAEQRQAFAAAFPGFAARHLSSDGYTAFLGVFGSDPGALLAIGTGVVAFRRSNSRDPRILSGWGFPAADRGSGAWLGFRLAGDYLDHLDGAAAIPQSELWAVSAAALGRERNGILAWLASARAAEFAAMAPAIAAAAAAGDPLGRALLDEGAGHLLRLARALGPAPGAPLCLGGGLADVYRPRLEAAFPGVVLPASRRPDPLRGAWLVATRVVAPEYPDIG
jgi:glucosamine kinase